MPLLKEDGKEIVTPNEMKEYMATGLPEVENAFEMDNPTALSHCDISQIVYLGDGSYNGADLLNLPENKRGEAKPEGLARKAAHFFDDFMMNYVHEGKRYPDAKNNKLLKVMNLGGPEYMIYIDGVPAIQYFSDHVDPTVNKFNLEKGLTPEKEIQFKACIAAALMSGKNHVSIARPVLGKDGQMTMDYRQVVPGYSDLTNDRKLSKEAQKRQAGADKLWSPEACEKDFLSVGKERMRVLTVSIEETILQELNKTQTYQNARWAYLSNPRLRSTIIEVPADEKGNRLGRNENPQLELPLVSKDDTREYKKDVMDLYRSRGKFAVSNGRDAENLKRLKTFAAARFDELLMPKLTLDADAKQSFYDAAEIPSPLDRVFIDGKPAKTFLKENLGYKADQITDDVLKAEIMGMATGGRNHVDIANAYSLGYDSNVRLQFAEVKLDLSGLDGLEHGYEKSRSARQNQLVRQDALKRHNYLDDLTLGWNKAKCKRARTEPVGKLIESNPEKYYEETGKTLVHAKELEQKRLENQKKRADDLKERNEKASVIKSKISLEELEGPAAEKNMDQRKRSGSVSIKKSKGMPEEKRTVKNDNKYGAVGSQPGAVNKYGAVGSQPGMDNRYGAVGSQPTRKRK